MVDQTQQLFQTAKPRKEYLSVTPNTIMLWLLLSILCDSIFIHVVCIHII